MLHWNVINIESAKIAQSGAARDGTVRMVFVGQA